MPEKTTFTLSSVQQDIFKKQTISQNGPGTLLQDFKKILALLGEKGVPVSGVKKHLPMAQLAELNTQLSHPVTLKLKRPVQKSYPHINALYLLVRASGIGKIAGTGKKCRLVSEPSLVQLWQKLTPAEQYFSLFEAWWCRGSDAILGERESFGAFDYLARTLNYFIKLPEKGAQIAGDRGKENRLRYTPGHHSLALLELFGFVTIQDGEPEQGKGWCVKSITPTDWGKAVLESIYAVNRQTMDETWGDETSVEEMKAAAFKEWTKVVQPYCTDWNTTLTPPEAPFQKGVHVVKISMGKSWRKIALSGESTFDAFAEAILRAFDFGNDHLYQFIYSDSYGLKKYISHPALEEKPFTDATRLGNISCYAGMEMIFFFDFGDCWEFLVQVEETDADTTDGSEPVILERRGKAPEQYPDYDDEW
ncbi:IS1096 element passenger TnpR family protein [Candidatus Electrothrix sp.]|uniref:IS1096 element passenger TnpR family protein n=2 Tax=Candidatus Electrothrix sp. TaxID=2170559 RepID=UPI004055EA8C